MLRTAIRIPPAKLHPRAVGAVLGLLVLCSCASVRPGLPAAVAINRDAGRDNLLVLMLRVGNGKEVPFIVDTGAPITALDQSLAPQLGARLGTWTVFALGATNGSESDIYGAPALWLGTTRLRTGTNVCTLDFQKWPGEAMRACRGILGMDCLAHYCVQLDFRAGKLRFLAPDQVKAGKLGQPFALTFSSVGDDAPEEVCPFLEHGSLIGGKGANLLIDTGCNVDGGMEPELFQQAVRGHQGVARPGENGLFAECVWEGQTYTNLEITSWPPQPPHPNLLGLRFLARHLVTFDFPNRRMYLKRTRPGPLPEENFKAAMNAAGRSAVRHMMSLRNQGLLPGWSKNDKFASHSFFFDFSYPSSANLHVSKKGGSSVYTYEFVRAAENCPWRLHRAWRAEPDDPMLEEYLVPF